jgi:hypothetical protein
LGKRSKATSKQRDASGPDPDVIGKELEALRRGAFAMDSLSAREIAEVAKALLDLARAPHPKAEAE